jgi:hypothetical protein
MLLYKIYSTWIEELKLLTIYAGGRQDDEKDLRLLQSLP